VQAAIARLLTSREQQAEFFAAPEEAAPRFGLTREEFRALRRIDPRKLGISSEGYAGKRFERVESAFPRTFRALDALVPGARGAYLAATRFPANEEEEHATFLAHVAAGEGWPAPTQRLLRDLADLEALLARNPPPPGLARYRMQPDLLRPRVHALLALATRGPLADALDAAPDALAGLAYPDAPSECLVLRQGPEIRLQPLTPALRALLADCSGERTLADLEARHGPTTTPLVEAWLRARLLA